MRILGLDIGGAHVKSAVVIISRGGISFGNRKMHPFEIYREKEKLPTLLDKIGLAAKPGAVALTMTAELSDVFRSRSEGVRWIIKTAQTAFSGVPLKVVDVDGALVSPAIALKNPLRAASANWAATARWISRHEKNCVIVDIGSTTADILPIVNGKPSVRGKDDFARLKHGELVYTGYLRTNAAHTVGELDVGGAQVRPCPEYFAIIGDASLYLGDITQRQYTCKTPDGEAKTKQSAGRRLARVVLSEPEILGARKLKSIATQMVKANAGLICRAIEKTARERKLAGAPIILIGSGAFASKYFDEKTIARIKKETGGAPVEKIDPAACAAAMWD